MLNILWNTQHYFFWLMLVSLLCFLLERLTPWRPQQKAWRDGIWQDFFWLIFNGHYAGIAVAHIAAWLILQSQTALGLRPFDSLQTVHLLSGTPLWLQFVVFMVLKDLAEWCVHNLLHRVPWLWQFHKLHHSIVELDWIGNMRFHWMEIVVYKSLTYLPLVVMGIDGRVILWVAIVGTLIGHLNHSNLKLNWGPLTLHPQLAVLPRLAPRRRAARPRRAEFAILFSLWDWLFGTAHMPKGQEQPDQLGFADLHRFPRTLLLRLVFPFWQKKTD
jgi:sterol desaturase/sphingolipid hydroxylase (fatty acid hydroxylase superfamily)